MSDPLLLQPAALCRMLNSTPLGYVLRERQLRRHRERARGRFAVGQQVDLLRYIAWLAEVRHTKIARTLAQEYESKRDKSRAASIEQSIAGRDIGGIPEVVDPPRKLRAMRDFRFFCEQYFPLTFSLPWSPDHLKVIAKIEEAVLRGGLFAVAMPRGSGKSTICECACIWAVLYGHREFVCLIGSDEGHAMDMLDAIKMELDGNDLLLDDFPEAVYPIRRLEGIANRCAGQLYMGERTHIAWTAKEIVLPTLRPHGWLEREDMRPFVRDDGHARSSGAIVKVAGITGRIRGMKFKRADGKAVRPSLVVLDDPQTDESARSVSQCATRESILAGAVLGLAGPGTKISGIMPCTVIRPGDMADNILDREKHPEWNGERTKMVYSFPRNEALWREYAEIRAESLRQGRGGVEATEFYRTRRAEMDAGAVVAWPERFNPDELSAIQHAMNLKFQDEHAFWAEYQNEPMPLEEAGDDALVAAEIVQRVNGLPRGVVPLTCQHVVAFIDVQATLLYYVVSAWTPEFSGAVIDYGTFPRQRRPHFTLRTARPNLRDAFPNTGLESRLMQGLTHLVAPIAGRTWRREDGAELRLQICLIDANWGQCTDVIYEFARTSQFASVVMPSHGKYIGPRGTPLGHYKRAPGDRIGLNWRVPQLKGKRIVRHVIYDANFWKSFVAERLTVPFGSAGNLMLWGEDPTAHRMFAEHCTAEARKRESAGDRTIDEWRLLPGAGDNHLWDCLVGSAVAASMCGAVLASATPSAAPTPTPRRKRQGRALW